MLGFSPLSTTPISAQPLGEDNQLNIPYLENANTFYAPTVQIEWLLSLPLLTNTQTFYDHVIGLEADLPSLVNVSTLYPPSAAFVVELPLLSDGDTLYAPTVAGFGLTMPFLDTGEMLYPPSSSLTPVDLELPYLPSATQLIPFHKVKRQRLIFTGVSYILE